MPHEDDVRAMKPDDRRGNEPAANEDLSDEYLAVLVVCGGTVRESDWQRLPASVAARRPATGREDAPDNDEALQPG